MTGDFCRTLLGGQGIKTLTAVKGSDAPELNFIYLVTQIKIKTGNQPNLKIQRPITNWQSYQLDLEPVQHLSRTNTN
jgi:hypothetical protein